jgi:SAM-dependent methyltransferase
MPTDSLASYDLVPYPEYCFPQTHPDQAAVIARLLGLDPRPVEHCRVLELGCASGANLIPMAEELPGSTFVGVDLSRRQIEQGQSVIGELGLANIELRHQGILDFQPGSELFDHVICHGVYSWVSPNVQDHILDICRHCLQLDGLAYVSYNTLPGWHMRGMIRDMMLYHGRRFSDPHQQVAQARGLLDFLVASVPMEENPYGQFLRSELEAIRREHDSYLLHDHLEEHNNPLYFHQFVERAAGHGLRYLAEVPLSTMNSRNFPPQVGEALQRVSSDLIQLEQYMDFLRNRMFRQTLLCHARHTPDYRLQPPILAPYFIGSPLKPRSPRPDLGPGVREDFVSPSGSGAWSIHPIVKAALLVLGDAWPEALAWRDLFTQARARLDGGPTQYEATMRGEERQLGQALLLYYSTAPDLVEFRVRRLPVTTQPGPRPQTRPLARWQARSGRPLTNLRHELVVADGFGRQVLQRLDGQHTLPAVAEKLAALVQGGQLTIEQGGEKITQPDQVTRIVNQVLEQQLAQFARRALLIA